MKPVECEFESEVLAAVLQSRWPDRVDAGLRAHVAGCGICSDVIAVGPAIEEERETLAARVVVPDSGQVWWRAQLRARREAARAAGRPITAAQVIALATATGLLGACFGAVSTWFQSTLRQVSASLAAIDFTAVVAEHGLLLAGMATLLFVVPAAVYLALGRD